MGSAPLTIVALLTLLLVLAGLVGAALWEMTRWVAKGMLADRRERQDRP